MKRIIALLAVAVSAAQIASAQRLEIVSGQRAETSSPRHYLRGMTDPDARIEVNGRSFKVYPTGAFAAEVMLEEGNNSVKVTATAPDGRRSEQSFDIRYVRAPRTDAPVEGFAIAEIGTIPQDVRAVSAGDRISLSVKATPRCRVELSDGSPLTETAQGGIYRGVMTVTENDARLAGPLTVRLVRGADTLMKSMDRRIEVLSSSEPKMLRTVGELPYINYGLGTDRLGGSKMSRITSGILLEAVGRVGDQYKVRLSKNRTAYVPLDCVEEAAAGTLPAQSLVGSWSVRGGERGDVVRIALSERLPFATFQQTDPARVVVDIYGAVANTSWITQYPETLRAIERVDYEQIEEDIFRVVITLRSGRHWGHSVSYDGTAMIIKVKAEPELRLRGLHVALDAGHGGPYSGAVGTTGALEKDVNLALVKMLRDELERRGAKVTLTREEDTNISMNERLLALRKADPDLVISIHCNAGGSPLNPLGTSTYYRHIGFRPLSTAILARLLTLGVNNFGNVGSFNFALNSPTEYPNVLVETLFISSPAEEAKLLDEKFRRQLVRQIVLGVEDYLKESKQR